MVLTWADLSEALREALAVSPRECTDSFQEANLFGVSLSGPEGKVEPR